MAYTSKLMFKNGPKCTYMNVNFGIRQISATLVQLRQMKANICNTFPIKANTASLKAKAATKFVADICLIWIGCCSFFPSCCRYLPYLDRCCTFSPSRVDLCTACQEYKSLQTSVFSSVALGLQAYQHQLTLE